MPLEWRLTVDCVLPRPTDDRLLTDCRYHVQGRHLSLFTPTGHKGSWDIAPLTSNLGTRWTGGVSFRPWPFWSRWKIPRCPPNMNWSGHFGEEKYHSSLMGMEEGFLDRPGRSLDTPWPVIALVQSPYWLDFGLDKQLIGHSVHCTDHVHSSNYIQILNTFFHIFR